MRRWRQIVGGGIFAVVVALLLLAGASASGAMPVEAGSGATVAIRAASHDQHGMEAPSPAGHRHACGMAACTACLAIFPAPDFPAPGTAATEAHAALPDTDLAGQAPAPDHGPPRRFC